MKTTACLLLEKQSLSIRNKKILLPSIQGRIRSGEDHPYCTWEEGSFGGTTFSNPPACCFCLYSAFSCACFIRVARQWVPRGSVQGGCPGSEAVGVLCSLSQLLGQADTCFVSLWRPLVRQLVIDNVTCAVSWHALPL